EGDAEDPSAVSTTDIKTLQAKKGVLAMRMVRIEGSSGRPPPPPLESEAGSEDRESLEQLDDEDVEERLSRPTDLSDELESADSNPIPDMDATTSRRPPPRRQRSVGPPVPPSARAVEKALKAPRFDPSKKRGRLWWEELFTDDFGRAIPPLNEPQLRQEVDFIERSLGVTQEGVVLDLACGTGHHAVEFASRGYNVVGYDLSVSQLAEASERAQERSLKINFLQGDMRELAFENTFDGIYCWNTSFGYFEEEKNIDLARRVFAALKSGGSFLLDVINRDFAVVQQPNSNWFEGDGCVCMDDMGVDFITSRLRVKRTVMLDDGRTRECNYSVRIYGLHELGKILHDIGFKVIQASGHPSMPGVFFGAQSPRVIILAAKP
ncbi:MAG TPA: class I SAM-dependent methyltransferase, partial [Polyangiaceae bacterium]|nr:class I SAM-dependent methyltransferase [Polyangiaceae bacterium]